LLGGGRRGKAGEREQTRSLQKLDPLEKLQTGKRNTPSLIARNIVRDRSPLGPPASGGPDKFLRSKCCE
jgi:hypothetical protein